MPFYNGRSNGALDLGDAANNVAPALCALVLLFAQFPVFVPQPQQRVLVLVSPVCKRSRSLVVEDDAGVRSYSSEALAELGYKVIEAANARAALGLLEPNSDIQVLFTDIGLPGGVNGRQLAEVAQPVTPGMPLSMMVGLTLELS